MSQILHIGTTENKDFFDCVLENNIDAEKKLKEDWLLLSERFYFKPFKIIISDMNLFIEIEPVIKSVFEQIGEQYPESIWMFYYLNEFIEHPNKKELKEWLKSVI